MAKWMKTNGEVIDVTPKNYGHVFTLEELKEYVGGWIECIYLNQHQVMVINDEGKLLGLPFNNTATAAFQLAFQPTKDFIVGNALLCELGKEID